MFRLALKMLLNKKLRLVLSSLGITIGVFIMIFILCISVFPSTGNIEGGIYKDITISEKGKISAEEEITGSVDENIANKIKNIENINRVAPVVETFLFFIEDNKIVTQIPSLFLGIDTEYLPLFKVKEGEYYSKNDKNKIIISKAFSEKYRLSIGDIVCVIPSKTIHAGIVSSENKKEVEITGIFENTETPNDAIVFGSYSTGKYLNNFQDRATVFYVELKDVKKVEETKNEMKEKLKDCNVEVKVETKKVKIFRIFENLTSTILFIVALFNVAFSSFKSISSNASEQEKEIGMLKAIGIPKRAIVKLFIYQGLIISALGCFVGIIVSAIFLEKFNEIFISATGITAKFFALSPQVIFYAVLFPFLAAFLVSLYPAYKVTKTKTIKMLKSR